MRFFMFRLCSTLYKYLKAEIAFMFIGLASLLYFFILMETRQLMVLTSSLHIALCFSFTSPG